MKRIISSAFAFLILCGSAFAQVPMTGAGKGAPGATNNLSLDGKADGNASTSSVTATLTTTKTNDIIYVASIANGCVSPTISDTASLSWSARLSNQTNPTWWAKAASILTSDVITVSCAGSSFMTVHAWGINGANTTSPFDPNVSAPITTAGSAPSITTTNASTVLLGGFRCGANSGVQGAGFTLIFQFQFFVTEYQVVSSPQTGTSVNLASGCSSSFAWADAVTQ